MNTFHILCLAGIGDILSHITRLSAVVAMNNHKIKFWLGGFGKSPEFMKEILEAEGVEVSLIKNLTYHSQLPEMREFIKSNAVKEGDVFQDWSFCEEIFQNKAPIFMQYPMRDRFDYKYGQDLHNSERHKYIQHGRCVAIQPLTKTGNAEGFESDLERGRFWSRDCWTYIIDNLIEDGFTPLFTGLEGEDWGLADYCNEKNYHYVNTLGTPIDETFEILRSCHGNIACNSWTWEITSRCGIPTVCFYTKNHFFIQNHIPDGPSDFFDNCIIETNQEADPEQLYQAWKYMYDHDKKPDVSYSVCMITYNDEECIEKTIDNVVDTAIDSSEFIAIDGGSTDKTVDILENNDLISVFTKKWDDDFEVQKNCALNKATNKWRVWIDADETYEPIFWNQLPWYIWQAENNGVDCISVPRINIIEGLTDEELQKYAESNGWHLQGFRWVNYPDHQQRIFTDSCKFVGRTHERITGYKKDALLVGVHCLHPKTKERQERGFERENKQYKIEADKIYERVMKDARGTKKTVSI